MARKLSQVRPLELRTVSQIVWAAGGPQACAEMFDITVQAVSNWKRRGKLPPETWLVLSDVLRSRGFDPPPKLFNQYLPKIAAE